MSYQNGFIQGITAKSTNAKKKNPTNIKNRKPPQQMTHEK